MTDTRWIDLAVVVAYLAAMAGLGMVFSGRKKGTDGYFLAGRSLPGWAVGLSMVGASISSITFLALPAAAYALDWRFGVGNFMMPVAAVLAVAVIIPWFRRSGITTAFEYLEQRFGPEVRLYTSIAFIIHQMIRIGEILYLLAIPVSLLLGLRVEWVILLAGLVVLPYTARGGLEAVIWIEVVQTIILLGGGLLAILFIALRLPEGAGQIFTDGYAQGKFGLGELHWDWGQRTFWLMIITGMWGQVAQYTGNQNVVQRFIAARSTREARKATILSVAISLPTWSLFYLIGTALFIYYQNLYPAEAARLHPDDVFPHFIHTALPMGISGFVIAAILAAGMSSVSSSINAISTVAVNDVVKRHLAKGAGEAFYVRCGRIGAVAAGSLMMGVALFFRYMPRESVMDLANILGAMLSGCGAGLFMMAFFFRFVTRRAVLTALVIALGFNAYMVVGQVGGLRAEWVLPIHPYWTSLLVNLVLIGLACPLSLLMRNANGGGRSKPTVCETAGKQE